MNPLELALRQTALRLEDETIDFAVVGALAVGARTVPRTTLDVDLAVCTADDSQAESLIGCLLAQGFRLNSLLEHEVTHKLVTARLVAPDTDTLVDLLFSCTGVEPEIVSAAELCEPYPGLTLRVAAVGHLMAMKVLSQSEDRLQDRVDLGHLRQVCTPAEAARATEACALIVERGYHRGRDLVQELQRWLPDVHK